MYRLCCILVLCASSAGAQSIITTETRAFGPRAEVEQGRMMLDRGLLRIDRGTAEGNPAGTSMIFRSEDQVLYHVDHRAKTYRLLSRDSVAAMGDRLRVIRQQMEERMAGLPEDQRALMGKMIEKSMPPPPLPFPDRVLTATGEQKEVSGFNCTRYEVQSGGEKKLEIWAADPEQVGLSPEQFSIFTRMSAFYADVFQAMRAWSGPAASPDPMGDFGKLAHFPILVRHYQGTQVTRETLFKDCRRAVLPPDAFEPPASYTKRRESPAS